MTVLDYIVIAWIVLWAVLGAGRGLVEQVLSLTGLVVGALAGSRIAPALLPGGRESLWLPLVALGGALVGAVVAQALLLTLARPVRRWVADGPARTVDRGGGIVIGALGGLALAWLLAAVVVFQPAGGELALRDDVHESRILSTALRLVPPGDVLGALARIDAFPIIPLPAAALPEPDPSVARSPGAQAARRSVVQLRGSACGLIKQGSGWVAGDDLVVTNAHVIAGEDDTRVTIAGGPSLAAEPVYVDGTNDVAVLRVDGLDLPALELGDAPRGAESVTLLGYPDGGPLTARAGTASAPRTAVTTDAYGNGGTVRSIIVTRGTLGPGSSGGPIVDADGEVVAMIFGGSEDGASGAAVPPSALRSALGARLRPVSSGPCT